MVSAKIRHILENFSNQRQKTVARYQEKNNPVVFFKEYGNAVETLLTELWLEIFDTDRLCLLATGGFGRKELYPYSDIDLAIVAPDTISESEQEKIARFIQTLWDIKLMPSVKSGSCDELCASIREDISGDTAFLEARFLCGNRKLAEETFTRVDKQRDIAAFVEAKLVEMQLRHSKSQGSGAALEPNIKNCPGGLRDIHTMLWIAKAQELDTKISSLIRQNVLTCAEAATLAHSYKILAAIRITLHINAKRSEDKLVFDLQDQVAEHIVRHDDTPQKRSEKLMRIFYRATKSVKQLNGILLPMLQNRIHPKPKHVTHPIDDDYYQINNQVAAKDIRIFCNQPVQIFKIIQILQRRNDITSIEPQTLRAWWSATRNIRPDFYNNPDNRRQFISFFQHGEGLTHIMRFLNLYGVLGRYLPAWEKITGLLQHDLFHIYPVDDHILTVLHNIRRFAIEARSHENPFASSLMQSFPQQHILYLAAIFHDIAKGRGGNHSLQGVADARKFAADHFLSQEESDLLAWLVENHLLMSTVAQKEDIQDPDVISNFCSRIGTQKRLTALYLLTIADIRGTNPKLWNNWRASLLETLFHTAARNLNGEASSLNAVFSRRQHEAADLLSRTGAPEAQQKKLWRVLGSAYFVRHQTREILWHTANLVHDIETPLIRSRILPESDTFQVMIFMPNGPRLFARLCRIFSRHGFDILAARAFITEHNYILDTFIVQIPSCHHPSDYPNIQSALEAELNSFIHGYTVATEPPAPNHRMSRRGRYMPITPSVTITRDEDYSDWYTVEITAVNRTFLLADLAEVFFAKNVSLRYAKIATMGERVEDNFIIYSPDLENPRNQSALKQALLEQLNV